MPNIAKKPKQVLVMVKPAKRGYIVEAAGSGQPYPCLTPEDIGEAVIEILNDPNQASAEFVASGPEATNSEPQKESRRVVEEEVEEEYEPEQEDRPAGWTAGDELLVNMLGQGVERLRNMSKWRK